MFTDAQVCFALVYVAMPFKISQTIFSRMTGLLEFKIPIDFGASEFKVKVTGVHIKVIFALPFNTLQTICC